MATRLRVRRGKMRVVLLALITLGITTTPVFAGFGYLGHIGADGFGRGCGGGGFCSSHGSVVNNGLLYSYDSSGDLFSYDSSGDLYSYR